MTGFDLLKHLASLEHTSQLNCEVKVLTDDTDDGLMEVTNCVISEDPDDDSEEVIVLSVA